MRLSLFTAGLLSLGFAVAGCTESTTPTPPGGTGGMATGTGGSGTGGSGTGGMAGGTGGMGVDMGAPAPTFDQVKAIFTGKFCFGCHSGSQQVLPGVFAITTHASLLADSLECTGAMAKKRVKPGDAANSYIINKIRGTNLCPKVGGGDSTRMPPPPTAALSEAEIKQIEDWINAGAKM